MTTENPDTTFDALTRFAEEEVHDVVRDLPPEIRRRADAIPVFFERAPGEDDVDEIILPDTLGLFDEGPGDPPMPRIRLWLLNIWDFAGGDETLFREEARITFLHELGHALGWDEDDLEARGLD